MFPHVQYRERMAIIGPGLPLDHPAGPLIRSFSKPPLPLRVRRFPALPRTLFRKRQHSISFQSFGKYSREPQVDLITGLQNNKNWMYDRRGRVLFEYETPNCCVEHVVSFFPWMNLRRSKLLRHMMVFPKNRA